MVGDILEYSLVCWLQSGDGEHSGIKPCVLAAGWWWGTFWNIALAWQELDCENIVITKILKKIINFLFNRPVYYNIYCASQNY